MESTAILVLYPHYHPVEAGEAATLVDLLATMGLIGDAVPMEGHTHYATGDELLNLVTFLGCAPHVMLEPPPAPGPMDFVNVGLTGPLSAPRLRRGRNTITPPCPTCGAREHRWEALPGDGGPELRCNACGTVTAAVSLNWRKTAAVANCFIDIWGVYPAEAVPNPALMERLAAFSGGPWRHAYLLDELVGWGEERIPT
ncbi:MAG: hypothetical protein U5S82_16080 [Gammaproteobacteria bacterium]|nr:hypothetical protein [Gammaproteobacteria bacterium]